MLGSKNNFFHKPIDELIEKRTLLKQLLFNGWDLYNSQVNCFLEAYDYFVLNPNEYDGATIVNDLCLIKGLDIFAMIHDYLYIKYNVAVSFINKFYADLIYCKLMREFKIPFFSVWVIRFTGLSLSGLFFIPREYFYNKKRISLKQKLDFKNFINNLSFQVCIK